MFLIVNAMQYAVLKVLALFVLKMFHGEGIRGRKSLLVRWNAVILQP